MSIAADMIIDGLGGTSAVAKMMSAPVSTVHSWRKNGIPSSRIAHLKLIVQAEGLAWPLDSAAEDGQSCGKSGHVTAAQPTPHDISVRGIPCDTTIADGGAATHQVVDSRCRAPRGLRA